MRAILYTLILQALVATGYGANLLRRNGVSCSASSFHPGYSCEKVYNGDLSPGTSGSWASEKQDSGAWLEVDLGRDTDITSVGLYSRCNGVDQYSGVTFEFSDGSKLHRSLPCDGGTNSPNGELWSNCDGQTKQELPFSVRTKTIRMKFDDSCHAGGHAGIREVEVQGVEVSGDLLQGPGVSCSASSEHSGGYPCTKTTDGDFSSGQPGAWATQAQNSGAWLKYTFAREVLVTSINTWSRCNGVDQFNGAEVVFSDGTKKDMSMDCSGGTSSGNGELWSNCDGQKADELTLPGILTTSVQFNFKGGCHAGGNPGLREVKIFGIEPTGNILEAAGVTCSASSHHSGYGCERAYDGNISPGINAAYASEKQESGAWLQFNLPGKATVRGLNAFARCTMVDQYKGAELVFSDGSKTDMNMRCDGDTTSGNGELMSNCQGQTANEIELTEVTDSLRMNFDSSCKTGGHGGLRELELEGSLFAGNLLRTPGVTCRASSHVTGYECEHAYDGDYFPGVHGAWASDKEDSGGWLEVTFPREVVVTGVSAWNRCIKPDQYSGADIDFGNGVTESMSFTCDGTSSSNGDLWENCNGQRKNEISVAAVRTKTIRFNFKASCQAAGHAGVRELEVHGFFSSGCPVM